MKRKLLMLAVAFGALPAVAQQQEDRRAVLWGEVRVGMTIDEIRMHYPEDGTTIKWHGDRQTEIEDVTILDECEAEVEIHHGSGIVEEVIVKGRGSIAGRCSERVFDALAARYGQPDGLSQRGGGLLSRRRTNAIWSRDGVTMRFSWNDDNGLGGSGLLQSSWEMRYTGSSSEVNL